MYILPFYMTAKHQFLNLYMVFPLIIWAAISFDPRGSATSLFVFSVIVLWDTIHGFNGSGPPSMELKSSLLTVQVLLTIVTPAGLILAAVIAERKQVEARLLESEEGYDVETCIDGRAALEIYKKAMESKEPFDVVILDLTNKIGMGGQETMRRLLKIDPDVKGIIITGYSDDPVVANFKAYGFSGFVIKPATRDELSKVINEVLS